jgi:hypothetical protein
MLIPESSVYIAHLTTTGIRIDRECMIAVWAHQLCGSATADLESDKSGQR